MPAERRLTSAEIRRKTNKPIMEKKRRERINKCLDELKNIVLRALNEESRPNKLEKADILEMTVRYLRTIRPVNTGQPSPQITDLRVSNGRKQAAAPIVKHEFQKVIKSEHPPPVLTRLDTMRHPVDAGRGLFPNIPPHFQKASPTHPVMFNMPGKYSPIPLSPISSASSKSPCRENGGSPFDDQAYRYPQNCQPFEPLNHGPCGADLSQNGSPYWLNSVLIANRSNELSSPNNSSSDTSIDFPSQPFQSPEKEESFLWRPWGVTS